MKTRSMAKQCFAYILAVLLLLAEVFPAFASSSDDKENTFKNAILELETYLISNDPDSEALMGILDSFKGLGNYNNSRSFSRYVSVLINISEERYSGDALTNLKMLENNEDFKSFIEKNLSDSSIGSVDKLNTYFQGRQYEYQGKKEQAIEKYMECIGFFDADLRLQDLSMDSDSYEAIYDNAMIALQENDYAGAYYLLETIKRFSDSEDLMLTIEQILGYKPESKTDNPMPLTNLRANTVTDTTIMISWDKTKHASGYQVFFRKSGDSQWMKTETKLTRHTLTNLKPNSSYEIRVTPVIGVISNLDALITVQTQLSKTPTPTPTATKAPITPTRTPAADCSTLGHTWTAATCTSPKTCSRCGATEGKAAGHKWNDATCTKPKTCSVCGATSGKALGHNWKDATCTKPKTCSRCGATTGNALGHKWKDATCTKPKTCSRCGATTGKAAGHKWKNATCTKPKTCSVCGATSGSALGHAWKAATESAPKTCTRCGKTEGSKLTWSDWSSWSTTAVSASSTRQVETRTTYHYKRWRYYNTKQNKYMYHYKQYTGSEYKAGSGEWQYKTTTEALAKAGTVSGSGVVYYSGYWYLDSTVVEYRHRDLR